MNNNTSQRNQNASSYSRGGQGCQVYQNGVRCGETKTLTIIQEFKQLYEDKMRIIDQEGSGDCGVQAKINLQQDWIRDLTEQNEMLVRAVEELEQEATERVLSLEEKLKQSSKCACETINLLEEKERKIGELERQIENISKQSLDTQDSSKDNQISTLKQSMLDMRDALTAEVADKHDTIVMLRRDVQILEDQCRKADQQTHFKDDIIKELRKELKQLKTETKNNPTPKSTPHNRLNYPHDMGLDVSRIKCPIKTHNTLEKYKDCENRVVIFACEDTKHKEVHKTYDNDKIQVVYRNPKVVHEYKMTYLKQLLFSESKGSVRVNSNAESTSKMCAYDLTEHVEIPEKLVDRINLTKTNFNSSNCKSESGNFEILNSYPPMKREFNVVCQHPPIKEDPAIIGDHGKIIDLSSHYRDVPFVRVAQCDKIARLKYDCFTCTIETPKGVNCKTEDLGSDDPVKLKKKKSKFTKSLRHYYLDGAQAFGPDVKALQQMKTYVKLKDSKYCSFNNSV